MARGTLTPRPDRGPDYWQLSVEAGRDPVTGKRRRASRAFTGTRKQAQAALTELVHDTNRGRGRGTTATMGDLLARWVEHKEARVAATTLREYKRLIRQRILPALGDTQLRRLLTSDIDAFYRQLAKSRLGPGSVRKAHAIVRGALGQGVRWGWLEANPAINAEPPSVRKAQITPPDPAQVVALLDVARAADPHLAVCLHLAAATGARRGEIVGLRWTDINLDLGEIVIHRSVYDMPGAHRTEKDTKTHAARRIAIGAGLVAVLEAHGASQSNAARAGGVAFPLDGFVLSDDLDGSRPWRPDRVSHAFARVCRQARISGVRLHDLRHFQATRLLAAGTDVRTVAGRLGHASPKTTLDVYAAWVPAADRVAGDIVDNLLRP